MKFKRKILSSFIIHPCSSAPRRQLHRYAPFSIVAKRVEAMKATLVIFAVIFATCCAVGQTMSQEANRNTGVEQELRRLEGQWQEALTRRDVTMLDRLMADDYVLTTVSGEVVNKARVLAEVKSTNATADVRNTEVAVRVFGDVAIVTGLVLISGTFNEKDVSTRSRYIKVYVKRQGQWRVVAAQATLIAQS
jgi:ketosteroid isomerase-like protein